MSHRHTSAVPIFYLAAPKTGKPLRLPESA
jgi:hypothetical protein